MTSPLIIPLNTSPVQFARLESLQAAFAEVCNAIVPVAQAHRCWNRVALHHLVYHDMRRRFAQVGSQMVCNAIYSVCRSYRLILNHPASPWNLARRGDAPLPRLKFLSSAPVYFDRHTLTLRPGQLSMYTLDGRLRFQLDLSADTMQRFRQAKLREIMLLRVGEQYRLQFLFDEASTQPVADDQLPEYLIVLPAEQVAPASHPPTGSGDDDLTRPRTPSLALPACNQSA